VSEISERGSFAQTWVQKSQPKCLGKNRVGRVRKPIGIQQVSGRGKMHQLQKKTRRIITCLFIPGTGGKKIGGTGPVALLGRFSEKGRETKAKTDRS